MYTQCPDCTTVFRLGADVLRIAQGEVRCGVCSTSFNAIEWLSEQPFQQDALGRSPDDSMTVEELPGTEEIELSSATEGVGFTAQYPADLEPVSDASMEFDADDADLEQVFVELPAPDLRKLRGEPSGQAPPAPDPAEIAAKLSATEVFGAPKIVIPDEFRRDLAEEAAANAPERVFDEPVAPEVRRRRWPVAVVIALLALLLGAQVVHSHRDQLARDPVIGPLLVGGYQLAGLPIDPPVDLAAFELRQWGAANDAAQPGRLRLRASIVNRAPFAQPFPLLRLALQDRFGTTIGLRDVAPDDYLPGTSSTRLMAPGQRADAEIAVVDPGPEAVGFEIDVCLPAGGGVRCSSDKQLAP